MPLIEIKIDLEAGKFKSEAASVEGVSGKASVGLDSLASKATAVSFAFNQIQDTFERVARVAAVPIKKFAELESSMANVQSLGVPNIDSMTDAVLRMGDEVPVPLDSLTSGLYDVVSAGVDAASQIDVLEISARAAKAGLTTTTDALNLGSAVIKGYGLEWSEMERVMDLAFQTVKLGQTDFPKLANSMGAVIPLASALKINTDELFGSFATLTGVTGNTSEVSTQLRGVMQGLAKPTKQLSDLIKEQTGLSVEQAAAQLGLSGILEILAEDTQGSAAAMSEYFGSVEAVNAILALSTSQFDTFIDKTAQMTDSQGAMTDAFDVQSDTINSQIQLLENRWDRAMVRAVDLGVPFINSAIDIALAIADARSEIELLTDEIDTINSEMSNLNDIDNLIARYDELQGKTNLSQSEHKELSEIIAALSEQYPTAITQVDQYGKAIGISADKVKLLVEQKRALLRAQEQEVLEDAMGKLAEQTELALNAQKELEKAQDSGTRRMGRFAVETVDTADAIRAVQKRLADNQVNLSENITLLSNFFDFDADRGKLALQLGLNEQQVDVLIEKWRGLNDVVEQAQTIASTPGAVEQAITPPEPVPVPIVPLVDPDTVSNPFKDFFDDEVAAQQAAHEQMLADRSAYIDAKREVEIQDVSFTLGNFATIAQAAQGRNEELFIVGKAAGVAQATVDTYVAANKALATFPPPFSFIAAASAVAAGLVNVDRIVSTNFERRAAGGFLGNESRTLFPGNFGGGENRLIIANDGEFIVNAAATARHREVLEKINSGTRFLPTNSRGGADGGVSTAEFNQLRSELVGAIKEININIKGTLEGQDFLREEFPKFDKDENDRRAF